MRGEEYSDEKCAQILADVEVWAQKCQKCSDYKFLSRDAKKNLVNVASFFSELMYSYHTQSPDQWTETALHNLLTEIYPYQVLVLKSYYDIVEPVLSVFIKCLQNIGVITPIKAQTLDKQLKISAPEMLRRFEQANNGQNKQLLKTMNNIRIIEDKGTNISNIPENIEHVFIEPQQSKKHGRNDPCPCGSGEKYKKCCLSKTIGVEETEKIKYIKTKHSTNNKEPTLEQWTQLYEVAKNIRAMEPWNILGEEELITIMLPGWDEPIFCSALGSCEECFGVGIYPGYIAIDSFYRLLNAPEGKFHVLAGFEQTCLMCYFGDSKELTPRDREVIKDLKLRFRGKNEWIYFRSFEQGYFPWFINSEQANLLIQVLQNFVMACTHLDKLEVKFDEGETLMRMYAPEKKCWLNAAIKMPPIPEIKRQLVVDDKKLIAQLKKAKFNTQKLEFEVMYLPIPIQENEEDRPRLAQTVLLADKTNETAIDQYIADIDDTEVSILEALINYIEQYGRPLSINVRGEYTACYIRDLCKKAEIELIEGKGIPTIEKLLESMIKTIVKEIEEEEHKEENGQ
jgi:hypothetical protein